MKPLTLCAWTAAALFTPSVLGQVSLQRLGIAPDTDPFNPPFSDAYGVSDSGQVVGSQYIPGTGFRGFSWTSGGGRVQLDGVNPSSGVFARSITPDGSVIVGDNTGPQVAFRRINGVVENLGISNPSVYDGSSATDVSNDGSRVTGQLSRIEDGTFRAAVWDSSTGWRDLGAIDGDVESAANTISGDGQVIAGYSVGSRFTAVKWTKDAGMQELPNPFGLLTSTSAIASSLTGSVMVGQAIDLFGQIQAVAWNEDGSSTALPLLAGFDSSSAFAVSADGSLIGGTVFNDQVGGDTATFWLNGVAYDLKAFLEANGQDLTGWQLIDISEVSQNGQYLTGRAFNPDGRFESFFVQIPAPSAALPMIAGVLVLARRRRS